MDELKKCPFCGGEAQAYSDSVRINNFETYTVWRVQCYECRAIIQRKTRGQAIADWNRRAE